MAKTFRIHPAIGIARLGNSPDSFYLGPERAAALPQECDSAGNPRHESDGQTPLMVTRFKDDQGRIRKQAARFQIYVYEDGDTEGRPLQIGDRIEGGGNSGTLVDIQWRVHLANKKASWYEFQQLSGEHGYLPDHPRRNAHVTGADRQRLIIDPGPRIVNGTDQRTASFDRSGDGLTATQFPPEDIQPHRIDTLGNLLVDGSGRLLVLGGHGHSGTERSGPGNPSIQDYANNDGWFDDTADGPVFARLVMFSEEVQRQRFVDVEYPAWVLTGYPAYVPEILDIITMDEAVEDMFVRDMAYRTDLFGRIDSFDNPEQVDSADPAALRYWRAERREWNPNYHPWFWRDVWPILFRPNEFNYLTNILAQSNYPHAQETRGTFNPEDLSRQPGWITPGEDVAETKTVAKFAAHMGRFASLRATPPDAAPPKKEWSDPFFAMRQFLFQLLRLTGEENEFREEGKVGSRLHNLPLMPLLCGDNPITNELPRKFLRLTDMQLFILKQWADGKFINEYTSGLAKKPKGFSPYRPYPTGPVKTGRELDRGVLGNILGGAFCPGGEVGWILRNPSIYTEPYRIKADLRFSTFRQTAAQASSQSGVVDPDEYIAYLDFGLDQNNDFDRGLQPGDLTKYMSVPWQADFNECSTQLIDVTYDLWNSINTDGDSRLAREQQNWETLWWPAHRPMQTFVYQDGAVAGAMTNWARGIPQTSLGDLKMVTEWWRLGFVVRNPTLSDSVLDSAEAPATKYVSVEASFDKPGA